MDAVFVYELEEDTMEDGIETYPRLAERENDQYLV